MTLEKLLEQIRNQPDSVQFDDVIQVINDNYDYHPVSFKNGEITNEAGSNEGSCKIFAFGLLNNLSEQETLACFGDYYRVDVLQNPAGNDHANIRNFILDSWLGIHFDELPLAAR